MNVVRDRDGERWKEEEKNEVNTWRINDRLPQRNEKILNISILKEEDYIRTQKRRRRGRKMKTKKKRKMEEGEKTECGKKDKENQPRKSKEGRKESKIREKGDMKEEKEGNFEEQKKKNAFVPGGKREKENQGEKGK